MKKLLSLLVVVALVLSLVAGFRVSPAKANDLFSIVKKKME